MTRDALRALGAPDEDVNGTRPYNENLGEAARDYQAVMRVNPERYDEIKK